MKKYHLTLILFYKVVSIIIILLFSTALRSQVIDTVVIQPYSHIDSIEYWHSYEIRENDQEYLINGYYQYCVYKYNLLLKDYHRRKIISSEGFISNGEKHGEWIYWGEYKRNVKILLNEN